MNNDKKPAIIKKNNADIWADAVNVPHLINKLSDHFGYDVDDTDKESAYLKAVIECFSDFIDLDSMKKLVAECNAEYGDSVPTIKEYFRTFAYKFIDTCDLDKLEKSCINACLEVDDDRDVRNEHIQNIINNSHDEDAVRAVMKNGFDIFLDELDFDRFSEIIERNIVTIDSPGVAEENISSENSQKPCAKFFALVDEYRRQKNLTDPELYYAAGVQKATYSAIKVGKTNRPKKITALALCIGLNLTLPQAQELLGTLDYELSDSPVDRIVSQCLERGNCDIRKVNEMIYDETGESPFNREN